MCSPLSKSKFSLGLTLIEMMVTVSIMAILAGLAAPSFMGFIQSSQISSAANTFLGDFRFARSEAVRRGTFVVMCRSNAPESDTPQCISGAGIGNSDWRYGWIIFEDRNNSGTYDATEELLRVRAVIDGVDSITQGTPGQTSAIPTKFQFTSLGRQKSANNNTQLHVGVDMPTSKQRLICISLGGLARVAGDGTATCA